MNTEESVVNIIFRRHEISFGSSKRLFKVSYSLDRVAQQNQLLQFRTYPTFATGAFQPPPEQVAIAIALSRAPGRQTHRAHHDTLQVIT